MMNSLQLSHHFWANLLGQTDTVIDATCGNGKDTLKLAELVPEGQIYSLDIQKEALAETEQLLKNHLNAAQREKIFLLHQSHVTFPPLNSVKLIVYNLGYLPKGDKSITTLTQTTLASVTQALELIVAGGAVSIVCYPGHAEGATEEKSLVAFASALSQERFTVFFHQHINRKSSPSFLWIVKKSTTR